MRASTGIVTFLAFVLLVPPIGVADADSSSCAGRIVAPADGVTVVSVQGAKVQGPDRGKRAARLVAFGPRGEIRWVHRSGRERDVVWSYDVDPLPNGHLFVTATERGRTVFYELDPRTGDPVWTEKLDIVDTHDADLLDRHRILIANMRAYNESSERNDDRLFVYNRTSGATEWEWRFADRYSASIGGNYTDDWTHVNDVDALDDGRIVASPRNFDQVIVVNRDTGEIEHRLGADDDYSILHEQHNPQYLESDDGRPTILVADSGNDRIVEYEKRGDGWTRTWTVGDSAVFAWPRDADRLPNGNTLIGDSANHRVVEVTADGRAVWEVYAPWLVYDVERVRFGDEPGGPTVRDRGTAGTYPLSDAAPPSDERLAACDEALGAFENPTPGASPLTVSATATSGHGADGNVPDDASTDAPGQPGFGALAAVAAVGALAGRRAGGR